MVAKRSIDGRTGDVACGPQYGWLWKAITLIGVMLTVMGGIVVLTWDQSGKAMDKVDAAVRDVHGVKTSVVELKTALPYIQRGIDEIKSEQAVQRRMLTELSREIVK